MPDLATVEYRVFRPAPHDRPEQVEEALNNMASSGWRLVTAMAGGAWLVLEREATDA